MPPVKGLRERMRDGEHILIAEGYMWEFEKRGYVSAGSFTPEVVVDHPEVVRALSQEFVHAGTDIVEAFTYYGHRAKLRTIDREDQLTTLNKTALKIAREVADEHGKLMAGNISNTNVYKPNDQEAAGKVDAIFKEQIEWAVEGGADLIIAETFTIYGEADLALKAIQKYGNGLPSVVTLQPTENEVTYDGVTLAESCRRLEEAGATVVGLNCSRGPDTMLTAIKKVREACKGPVACLPVPIRTNEKCLAFQDLKDERTGEKAFPTGTEAWACSRSHIADFAREALALGIQYIGLCCGNKSMYMREVAEVMGRTPPASKYGPDMSKHISQIKDEEYAYVQDGWKKDYVKQE